jgi:hypothetical protein
MNTFHISHPIQWFTWHTLRPFRFSNALVSLACIFTVALVVGGAMPSVYAQGSSAQAGSVEIASLVTNGMGGIMVFTSPSIVSPSAPVQGVTGFNVYRRTKAESGNDAAWQKLNTKPVCRSNTRADYTAILGNDIFARAAQFYNKSVDEVWATIQTATERKPIGAFFIDPRAVVPFGGAFVDSSASKDVLYEYAVAPLTAAGEGAKKRVGEAKLEKPERLAFLISSFKALDSTRGELSAAYLMMKSSLQSLYAFELWRGDGLAAPMKRIALVVAQPLAPKPRLMYIDTTLQYGKAYRYAIVPVDVFYNKSSQADTLRVIMAKTENLPMPQNLLVSSTTAGLRLTWENSKPPRPEFRGTIVLRSVQQGKHDGAYQPIDTVAYSQTEYIDRTVKPLDDYYYRLQTLSVDFTTGDMSTYNGTSFEMGRIIAPPTNLRAISVKNGVRLSWSPVGKDMGPTQGYFVYRALSATNTLEQISTVVTDTVFVDSASHANPYSPYYYAVATVNGSYKVGSPSERIAAMPLPKTPLPAPATPAALQDVGAVVIEWNNAALANPAIAGYNVYRTQGKSKPEKLTTTALASNTSQFRDTAPLAGEAVSYSLTVIDLAGVESSASVPVPFTYLAPRLTAPSTVRASIAGKSVVVRWSASNDGRIVGYEVFRSVKGEQRVKIASVKNETGKPLEYKDASIKAGTPHYYTVVAIGKTERSSPSNEATVLP